MNKLKKKLFKLFYKFNFMDKREIWGSKLFPRTLNGIIVDIGSSCNSKCPFCPRQEKGFTFEGNGIMSGDVFDVILEQLARMPQIKNVSLYAFGEPLLNPKVDEFIDKLLPLKKQLFLSTNTTNLEKHIESMLKLDKIQFSIEGWDKESYEIYRQNLKFDETIERLKKFDNAIQKARDEGIKTPERSIHLLLTKKTQIEKFIETWGSYVDIIVLSPMYPYISWSKDKTTTIPYYNQDMIDDYFILEKPTDIMVCNDLNHRIAINANGKAVLCCSDFSQHLELGDYKDLNGIFNSKILWDLYKKILRKENHMCKGCVYAYNTIERDILEYFPQLKEIDKLQDGKNVKIVLAL